ncbi:MAG TPA: DUF3341 domain-containing protein [Nitrolancea sp.]|nr:DUF3341 domain-containing protein [Nitrolancea sp.]
MALRDVLGLYSDLDSAVAGADRLEEVGLGRPDFEVLSNAPFPEGTFGHAPSIMRLGLWPLIGAAAGFSVGLLVTGGTQLVYPMVTDGKPLFSIPPMVIIMYEGTMLAAVIFTVLGTLFESRLPRFQRAIYDTRITEGYIGLLVHAPSDSADRVAELLRSTGAEDVKMSEVVRGTIETPRQPRRKGANA